MRRLATAIFALLLAALPMTSAIAGPTCEPAPGPAVQTGDEGCSPTPTECATGDYNGVYDGGAPGRGAICVGTGNGIVFYAGGNANALCGTIIVADQVVTGNPADDPNECPQ